MGRMGSVSHGIPDTRFLDFAQKSNLATEPYREVHRKWAQLYAAYHQLLLAQQTAQE
jgi:hypothetical protein